MSFKLDQMIENNKWINWWNFNKKFFKLLPFASLAIEY